MASLFAYSPQAAVARPSLHCRSSVAGSADRARRHDGAARQSGATVIAAAIAADDQQGEQADESLADDSGPRWSDYIG
jgi:hypothetical protein